MSNTIWKTADQKPEDGSEILFMIGENHCVGYYDKHSGLYVEPKRFYDTEYAPDEIDRWIYADDLIAQADKAERLQKQLDSLKKYSDSLRHRVEKMLKKNKTLKNTAADYFMKSIELGIELEKKKSNN